MGNVARKHDVEASSSAERRHLAETIEVVKALHEKLARIRTQIEENPPYRALVMKDEAKAALRRALENDQERELARILGEPTPEGTMSVADARTAVDAATVLYGAAKQAEAVLQRAEADAMRSLQYAEIALQDAIKAVARPAITGLMKRIEVGQRELQRLRLTAAGVKNVLDREQVQTLWSSAASFRDVSGDPAWAAWIKALETNADAPPPELN